MQGKDTDSDSERSVQKKLDRTGWNVDNWWTPKGPRGMQISRKDRYMPNRYVRKWKEGNEEMLLHALRRFKSLRMRVVFQMEEATEDFNIRNGKPRRAGEKPRRWTVVKGKTLTIKKIPNQGMFWRIIEGCFDKSLEITQEKNA